MQKKLLIITMRVEADLVRIIYTPLHKKPSGRLLECDFL